MKGKYLMLVPETADGFQATINALRSLRVPMLKNLDKLMPES
jgi:hypothetical protein